MDLEGIRLLIHVAELGSMQAAAERLQVPRSSLRRRLENLEAEVGRPLLLRGTAGIALTPAGSVMVHEGRTLLEQKARLLASAASAKSDTTGRVVVVVPLGVPDVARLAAMRVLVEIAAGLEVEERVRPEPLEHLHEPFDLMIHFDDPPARGAWFSRVLARVALVPVASADYVARHGRPERIEDLGQHRILGWRRGRTPPDQWPLRRGGTLTVTPVFESTDGQILHRAAHAGMGILLGNADPLMDTTLHETSTPLVRLLEDEIGTELVVRCLSPQPSDASPRTRAVLEAIHAFVERISAAV